MSEVYIPSTKAAELSAALWALAVPPQVRREIDITSSLFPRITDLNGGKWIVAQDDYGITVHQEAELNGIADILQPWIDEGYLPDNTNVDLTAFVESRRGQWLVVYDAFPQFFKDQAKTRQQMIDDGLLPSPTP